MYEEKEKRLYFDWKGFIFKLAFIIIAIIVVVIMLPVDKTNKAKGSGEGLEANLSALKDAGSSYFKADRLPEEIGGNITVSLEELINTGVISPLKDSKGKECDGKKSFIKAIKKEEQYDLEVNLVCGKKQEDVTIRLGCFDLCQSETPSTTTKPKTTKPTTDKSTTNKPTTNNPVTNKPTTTKPKTTKVASGGGNQNKPATTAPVTKPTTQTPPPTTRPITTTQAPKIYAVIYNTMGGTVLQTEFVVEGTVLTYRAAPYKAGYHFDGWLVNGQEWNWNTPITKNTILVARWKPVEESI